MKHPGYSSLSAFLAHYRALGDGSSRTASDQCDFEEMERLLGEVLSDQERAALDSGMDDRSAVRRRRERAELKLRRELLERGAIAG